MNLYADKNDNVSKPKSFADVLEIFMPNSKFSNKESVLKNSGIMDTIRKQRERFNSGEN
jgi:flagellar protein FliO/FliZ